MAVNKKVSKKKVSKKTTKPLYAKIPVTVEISGEVIENAINNTIQCELEDNVDYWQMIDGITITAVEEILEEKPELIKNAVLKYLQVNIDSLLKTPNFSGSNEISKRIAKVQKNLIESLTDEQIKNLLVTKMLK